MRFARCLVVFAVFACAAPRSARAADPAYRFDKLAETGSTYTALGLPAVNNAGVAAFTARDANGPGVYYGTPPLVQKVQMPTGVVPTGAGGVDINNAGLVVFPATSGPQTGSQVVYQFTPGGGVSPVPFASAAYRITNGPVVNDAGRVAYVDNSNPAAPGEILLTTDGSAPATTWADAAGPGSLMRGPHISNDGKMVATVIAARYGDATARGADLFNPRTPSYTDPVTGVTGTLNAPDDADIGDNGRVGFFARFNGAPDSAFYVWQDGTITRVSGTLGAVAFSSVPAVNDLGGVAGLILSNDGTQRDRISLLNGAERPVISVGDAFDGSAVARLAFTAEGFNDLNQLAFQATLADGRTVNVLATVPEPGALSLLAIGGGLLLRRRSKGYRT